MNKFLLALLVGSLFATPAFAQTSDVNHQCGSSVSVNAVLRMHEGKKFTRADRTINGFPGVVFEGLTRDKQPEKSFTDFIYQRGDHFCWFWAPSELFEGSVGQYVKERVLSQIAPQGIPVVQAELRRSTDTVPLVKNTSTPPFNLEARKEEAREMFEAKKTELQTRLQQIKDERKRTIVERINEQMRELNERLMDRYAGMLDHLLRVLDKISSRRDKAAANNFDVSLVDAAIVAAEEAIADARRFITAQASQTYDIQITTEAELRNTVGMARQALHEDLREVFNAVKAAREAVGRALASLRNLPRIDEVVVPGTGGGGSGSENTAAQEMTDTTNEAGENGPSGN